jgi:hypothetical protein
VGRVVQDSSSDDKLCGIVWGCGLVAAREVVQGSGCGSSSSLGSHLVGAHGSVGSRFLGGVLQDSSSDDEAVRPKPAKVPRGRTVAVPVGIVCDSDSDVAGIAGSFDVTVKEEEENTEEDLVEEEDVIEEKGEGDEETISFTSAAAEEEARALFVDTKYTVDWAKQLKLHEASALTSHGADRMGCQACGLTESRKNKWKLTEKFVCVGGHVFESVDAAKRRRLLYHIGVARGALQKGQVMEAQGALKKWQESLQAPPGN